jgi:hypothetical protein
VKPKSPHIPWGRKRNRGKTETTEAQTKGDRGNDAKPERRLIQGCFEGFA